MKKFKSVNVIYIVGTSYSGSTIMGIVLGASHEVEDLGEIKYFERIHRGIEEGTCTCGKLALQCPFWSKVHKKDHSSYGNQNVFERFKVILRILKGNVANKKITGSGDYYLFRDILQKLGNSRGVRPKYLLDNSKSIFRLVYLSQCEDVNLKVIYIKREALGNVASYVKHGESFVVGLFKYWTIHFLIRKFLSMKDVEFLEFKYRSFCDNPSRVVNNVCDFLQIKNFDYKKKILKRIYHVCVGNPDLMNRFKSGETEIRYHQDWDKILNGWQSSLLKILTKVFRL